MAEYEVTHTTLYNYSEKVGHCQNIAYLTPQSDNRQTCKSSAVFVNPLPTILNQHQDYFGNRYYYFSVEDAHKITRGNRQNACRDSAAYPG
jgi:transglutaminase-like putative cysteine protease